MIKLNKQQKEKLDTFLFGEVNDWIKTLNREEWQDVRDRAYSNWYKAGRGYGGISQGGTGQMLLIRWYQNRATGRINKEWRPSIIIRKACEYLKIDLQ